MPRADSAKAAGAFRDWRLVEAADYQNALAASPRAMAGVPARMESDGKKSSVSNPSDVDVVRAAGLGAQRAHALAAAPAD
jgi:hypothetical protein